MSEHQRITPALRLVETPATTTLERCLEMFLLHQEASRHTPRTVQTYRETLTRFLEYLAELKITAPEEITPHAIRRFLVDLERRGLADTTVHKFARCIKTFCNFLVSEELLDASPMRKVAMPKLEKKIHPPFSQEEVEKLLAACGKGFHGLRDRAIVLCLLDSGLRAAEFVSLNVGDVDKDGVVRVRGKGQKDRYVVLGAQARKAVLRYLVGRGEVHPDDPLWVSNTGKRLAYDGLYQVLKRLGKRAGVWPVGPHRFRRTFAVWALRGGMDVHHLRAILGHSDLQMAQRYLALVKDDIVEAHRQASPVDRFLSERR